MWLPKEVLVFVWHSSSYSTYHTGKLFDFLVCEINNFFWLRHFCQYLNQYPPFPNKISTTHISYTYIIDEHLTFCMCIFDLCYQSYTMTVKMVTSSVTLHPSAPWRYLIQFQWLPHNAFTTYNSSYIHFELCITFSTETHDNAIFPHKTRRTITAGTRKGACQGFRRHCSRLTNDKTDFEFLMQNKFHRLTNTRTSKEKAFALNRNLIFVSTKPSVPHQRHLGQIWIFGIAVFTQHKSNIELTN